ncbi:MAG: hypothetical protein WBV40_06780 [Candidatus Cybelea sp.]
MKTWARARPARTPEPGSSAALTYVAAALQAVGTVLYYMMILSSSRRRNV